MPIEKRRRLVSNRTSRILRIFLLFAGVAALIILLYPWVPEVQYQISWIERVQKPPTETGSASDSDEINRLIIPKIGVDTAIIEGKNESALNQGAWRIPSSSTPDQGSNTVITGHRFRYLPPNNTTFYLLDKLKAGDEIMVVWKRKSYSYAVSEMRVVESTETSIQDQTKDSRLTLFTCTPLFSTAKRLVVVARPVE